MDTFFRLMSWFIGLFVARTRAAGAAEERTKINDASEAQLKRRNEVAQRPVTDEQLDKSLRDGTF